MCLVPRDDYDNRIRSVWKQNNGYRNGGAFDLYAEEAHFEFLPTPTPTHGTPTVSEYLHNVLQWLCENAEMILKIRPLPLIVPPFEAVQPELLTVSSNELWTFTEHRSALRTLNWTKSAVNYGKINLVLYILIAKELVKVWTHSWPKLKKTRSLTELCFCDTWHVTHRHCALFYNTLYHLFVLSIHYFSSLLRLSEPK